MSIFGPLKSGYVFCYFLNCISARACVEINGTVQQMEQLIQTDTHPLISFIHSLQRKTKTTQNGNLTELSQTEENWNPKNELKPMRDRYFSDFSPS